MWAAMKASTSLRRYRVLRWPSLIFVSSPRSANARTWRIEQPSRSATSTGRRSGDVRSVRDSVGVVGIADSLRFTGRSYKGQTEADLAPPACVPGIELAHRIGSGLRQGRPGCWIGPIPGTRSGLGVPRAHLVRFWPSGGGGDLFPPAKRLEELLPRRLALYVATEHPLAWEQLTPGDQTARKHLYAAALRDILGLSPEAVATACEYGGDNAKRTARREVSKARMRWAQLGAWPWFHFGPAGEPPDAWRVCGGGPPFDAAFRTWATGWFHVPDAAGARPLGSRTAE
jgi:hypothetical protein